MAKPGQLKIGDRVKLTGKFLKNTGQQTGSAGLDSWKIVGFWDDGQMAFVDEPHTCQTDPTGYEDIPPDERPKWRTINVANLYKVDTLTSENSP